MNRRGVLIAVMAIVAAGTAALSSAAPVRAENLPGCDWGPLIRPADVRGHTWIGTVTGRGPHGRRIRFAVERVYSDRKHPFFPTGVTLDAGRTVELRTSCPSRVFGFKTGTTYLVSAGFINRGGLFRSGMVAWEVHGDSLRLIPDTRLPRFDERLTQVRTIEEALALVAPGAVPDTGTGSEPQATSPVRGPNPSPWLILVGVAAALFADRQLRRRHTLISRA